MDKKKVLGNLLVASEAILGTWNLVIACRGLYDDITCRQERRWYVNCMNVDKVLNALRMRGIKYDAGSCGWAKAPSIWFVRFKCNGSVYAGLCREINERHVTVFNDNIGY